MNHIDLIRLAQQADIDGDIELADYLDNQLVRTAKFNPLESLSNFVGKAFNYSRRPHYNIDFNTLTPDASNLSTIAGHPTQRGNLLAKQFQAGLKEKARTPERLDQIDQVIKEHIAKVVSNDPNVHTGLTKYNAGDFANITPAERNALLNHLVNKDRVATRANDISPDDIIKVLSGQKPSVPTKQITTLSNAGYAAAGAGALGAAGLTGLGVYNTIKQQAGRQPGGLSQDPSAPGSPFQSMPEMGGGMPTMGEMPEMGGGGMGGYQGPSYNMPSANQSFQPMQGYQPANQVERVMDFPRTNDQAEPLYPRITPQQAMQNAMTEDQARRYRELMEQGGSPAAAPIVSPEVYGPTQEMANPGGVSYVQSPTTTDYLPAPPVTEGTNDPNANVIYTPETSPRTDNYIPT
jgi:hypothetical protein